MKRLSGAVVSLCMVMGLIGSASAGTVVRYGAGGSVTMGEGIVGEVIAYGEGWGNSARNGAVYQLPDAKTGCITWTAAGAHGLAISCSTAIRQEGDAIRFQAHVRSEADAKPECVAYVFNIDAAKHMGWRWTIETEKGPRDGVIAAYTGGVRAFNGKATSVTLSSPEGVKAYVWKFAVPQQITFQDSRKWGQNMTLRIGGRPATFVKGTELSIDFALGGEGGVELALSRPVVVKAGADWIPLDYRKSIESGSALDFSGMGFLDAPAGKYGWLRNVNGDFEFEKTPGVKRRFYGVNFCGTANTPSHEIADDLIVRLKRLGYNAIRLHHHERSITKNRRKEGVGFAADRLERMDYLVAKGIAEGFYFTTDIYVSRDVTWEDVGLPERGKDLIEKQLYKILVAIWEPAFDDWKRFARAFMEHVNPYTGRAYKDEPAMPLISLINEGQFTMGWGRGAKEDPIVDAAYRAWLAERRTKDPSFHPEAPEHADKLNVYGDTGAVMTSFMADLERRSAARMKAYLRSIGVKALVTNANCGPHFAEMNAVRSEVYDYTDDHFYVDHPQFLKTRWRLPSRCGNGNPVQSQALPFIGCAFTRIAGQPMCITEWNFSGPGMYRGVGGIMTGAFAALQDWSGLWRFAYSHSEEDLRSDREGTPGYFNVATDALGLMSDRASICLFLRGDLAMAEPAYAFETDAAALDRKDAKAFFNRPGEWRDAAWQARVAMTVPGAAIPRGMMRLPMSRTHEAKETPFDVKPNPAFSCDKTTGTFTLNTPLTSGGFTGEGRLDCGRVAFEVKGAPATVWASGVDAGAKDIATARRLLVFHLTDIQADGNVYVDETKRILLKWGKTPSVVRKGSARISIGLAEPDAYEVWSLRTDGSRLGRLQAAVENGRLAFEASVAGPEGARLVYEVVRK